jgi:hypothetical protein
MELPVEIEGRHKQQPNQIGIQRPVLGGAPLKKPVEHEYEEDAGRNNTNGPDTLRSKEPREIDHAASMSKMRKQLPLDLTSYSAEQIT